MQIKNNKNQTIEYDFYITNQTKKNPTLILLHGLISYKDEKYFNYLKKKLSKNYNTLSFDCTNEIGKSSGNLSHTSYKQRLKDLDCIINFLKQHKNVNKTQIGLIGHSLGGIICAHYRKNNPDILFSISMSSPYQLQQKSFIEFGCSENDLKNWEKNKLLTIKNPYHQKQIQLPYTFYTELCKLQIPQIFQNLKNHLVIQGKSDKTINYKNAQQIYKQLKEPKELFLIENLKHYYKGEKELTQLSNKINQWCKKFLKQKN